MPTPVYELQIYFKKPMENLRKSKASTVLWTIGPLCFLMLMTGRINIIGMLIFIGFLFLLPTLMGLPAIDISEKGIVYKSLRGRAFAGWDSIGVFADYDGKNPDRIMAAITGPNAKSFPRGFQKIGGEKYFILDLPPGQHTEAASRLNEFRDMIKAGVPVAGEREDPS